MLLVPLLAGSWLAGPAWIHLPLGAFWVVGYLAYHAAGRWLRSSRRPRERPPLVVYGAASVPLGLATLSAAPRLLWWVPAFLPLLALSLWWTARGAERSLRNDAVTVLAACLMAPVAFDAGGGAGWAELWVTTGVLVAYFLGTVLYVKTMIRERGRRGYVHASIGYHLAGVFAAVGLVVGDWQRWWLVAVWVVLLARAAVGPAVNARRRRPLRPAVVGVGEIVASVAVLEVAVACRALPRAGTQRAQRGVTCAGRVVAAGAGVMGAGRRRVAEHLEAAGVRFARCTTERVDRGSEPRCRRTPASSSRLPPAVDRLTARDAVGPPGRCYRRPPPAPPARRRCRRTAADPRDAGRGRSRRRHRACPPRG
jgi:hypothetical protein